MGGKQSRKINTPKTRSATDIESKVTAQAPSSGLMSLRTHVAGTDSSSVNDQYSRAVTGAVWEALRAGYRGKLIDRFNLFTGAQSLIWFCLQTANKDDDDLIYSFAGLNIQLTTFLDSIVQNSGEDDENLRRLRVQARERASWPTMVRPGDPKFSDVRIEKLGVGENSILRRAEKRPASFATPRNRLAAELIAKLCFLARLTSGDGGASNEWASKVIEHSIAEPNGQRIKELLALLSEIKQVLLRQSSPLTENTVSQWNRWISNFVLITDPKLACYPELQNLRTGNKAKFTKTDEADFRSRLEKFFHPALKNLSR
jgi:hypothetical protein